MNLGLKVWDESEFDELVTIVRCHHYNKHVNLHPALFRTAVLGLVEFKQACRALMTRIVWGIIPQTELMYRT
jgi:hypothetical protein